MKIIYEKKRLFLIIGGLILLILSLVLHLYNDKKGIEDNITLNITTENKTTKSDEKDIFYVDVKGNVNNPGVYEFKKGDRVIDAINLAGGLTKNANTNNINLSKKLNSEMVVYIYSNKEVKNNDSLSCNNICDVEIIEVNNCVESNKENNDLVNINEAGLEELLTLTGIGESKAKSIIEYRENNGKFKDINELKNVSGIGDALFEKIKDKIII